MGHFLQAHTIAKGNGKDNQRRRRTGPQKSRPCVPDAVQRAAHRLRNIATRIGAVHR